VDIKDLFGYNWYSRRRFLENMAEIPWETVTEKCGASFDSIRNIYLHSLQVEHVIIRWLSGKSTEGIYGSPFETYASVNTINEYSDTVEKETNQYLATLTKEKLDSFFEFKGGPWDKKRYRIEDVLILLVEEEIHHRGELLCIYWQHDIDPPFTSYLTYKDQI
jgi:uncharacterized damage-inducible protein DinB